MGNLFHSQDTYFIQQTGLVYLKRFQQLEYGWGWDQDVSDSIIVVPTHPLYLVGLTINPIVDWTDSQARFQLQIFTKNEKILKKTWIYEKNECGKMDINMWLQDQLLLQANRSFQFVVRNIGTYITTMKGINGQNPSGPLKFIRSSNNNGSDQKKGQFKVFIVRE